MPDSTLYHGTIYLTDTTTGAEANVAVQIAIDTDRLAYTIRSLASDAPPVTVTTECPAGLALLRELVQVMQQVTMPV